VRSILPLLVVVLTSCGGGAQTTGTAPKPKASAEYVPRCPASADDKPRDAGSKMESLIGDIRKCYSLGTPGQSGGVVKFEVTVAESGEVKGAKVLEAAGGHASAVECTEKAMKATKFGKFCGDDVSIRWNYPMQ
jgi:hypothetical protein